MYRRSSGSETDGGRDEDEDVQVAMASPLGDSPSPSPSASYAAAALQRNCPQPLSTPWGPLAPGNAQPCEGLSGPIGAKRNVRGGRRADCVRTAEARLAYSNVLLESSK
mmetsp:Transcript_90238/g.254625  ORF Transcript_90238/g.254625 Transcript_90238/m.254625 type:complete len:109 (-) Transcript_90238:1398-1724(-)